MTLRFVVSRILRELIELAEDDADAELVDALHDAHTVICLGDVAHPDAWRDDRLVLDLAECPGERLLVRGNHDRDVPALRRAGFHKTCRTALCATDPPLVLTHIPL